MGILRNVTAGILRLWNPSGKAGDAGKAPELESAALAFKAQRYEESVAICRTLVAGNPGNARAHYLCALALIELGDRDAARDCLEAAVKCAPKFAEALGSLALLQAHFQSFAEAETSCRRAIAVEPEEASYRLNLVGVLAAAGHEEKAYVELVLAQDVAPDRKDFLATVCGTLDRLGRHAELLKFAERALRENSNNFDALRYLAVARYGLEDEEGAVQACEQAIALRKDHPMPYLSLGTALSSLGRLDDALSAYRRALKLNPGDASIQFSIGLIQLMQGRYRNGWDGYDLRYRSTSMGPMRACEPRWSGSSLRDRNIVIMREQGLGDEIMFSSCYPHVIAQASQTAIECDPRLTRLMARSFPGARFFPLENLRTVEQTDPGYRVDVRSYAGSLPRYFRKSSRDFPGHSGYLVPDNDRVTYWRGRLAGLGNGKKIGISWRGGTARTRRRRRSLTLPQLMPLLLVPGAQWVNLQYGDRAGEIAELGKNSGISIVDWPEAIDGVLDETAALISALDLVISVATTVVHLSGALGKSTWVMVAYAPEWRYGATGDKMPWYPSVELIRQQDPLSWDSVISTTTSKLENALLAAPR
jgi:tetratricopeptide (TPR) repeat protein